MYTISNETRITALAQLLNEPDDDGVYPQFTAIASRPYLYRLEATGTAVDSGDEYLVLTDEEATKRCKEHIKETLYNFNLDWLTDHMKPEAIKSFESMSKGSKEAFQEFLSHAGEDASGLLLSLINDVDEMVRDAMATDGRGHFLAGYDDEEREEFVSGAHYEAVKSMVSDLTPQFDDGLDAKDQATVNAAADWLEDAGLPKHAETARLMIKDGGVRLYIYRVN